MKTLTQKEVKKTLERIINTHEDLKNSYFWGGRGYSNSNHDIDDDYNFIVKIKGKTIEFNINQYFYQSRKHSYYKLTVNINNQKKDIRALKLFIEDKEKFLKKFGK